MADVRVRNLDDWIVESLKLSAKKNGRSLEAELRAVLTEKALAPKQQFLQETRALRESIRAKYGVLPDSTPYIRAMRNGEDE